MVVHHPVQLPLLFHACMTAIMASQVLLMPGLLLCSWVLAMTHHYPGISGYKGLQKGCVSGRVARSRQSQRVQWLA